MSRPRKIALGLLAAAVLLVVAATVALLMYPRELITWYTRSGLERAGLEQQFVDHDHGRLSYFIGGEGPPLVFIHGLSDQAGSWHTIASQFDEHTVIAVDLPGHGDSPYSNGELLSEASIMPLFVLLDQLIDDEQAVIVGNSLGGWIAMEYALYHPEAIKRLVPVGSAGMEHDIDPTLLMPENRDDARRTIQTIFGDNPPPVPGFVLDHMVERAERSVVADVFDRHHEARYLDDDLPDLDVPTELIWGTEDLIFPLDYAERLHDKLARSRLHIIDGCGHSPQVGCPDEFAELLHEVLTDSAPPAQ